MPLFVNLFCFGCLPCVGMVLGPGDAAVRRTEVVSAPRAHSRAMSVSQTRACWPVGPQIPRPVFSQSVQTCISMAFRIRVVKTLYFGAISSLWRRCKFKNLEPVSHADVQFLLNLLRLGWRRGAPFPGREGTASGPLRARHAHRSLPGFVSIDDKYHEFNLIRPVLLQHHRVLNRAPRAIFRS